MYEVYIITSSLEEAEAVGLQDDDMLKYILNQHATAREERNQERKLKLKELEAERGKAEEESERDGNRSQREMRLAHELDLAEINAGKNSNNYLSPINASGTVRPDLPVCQEGEKTLHLTWFVTNALPVF